MPEAFQSTLFWAAMALCAIHIGLALAAAAIPGLTALLGLGADKRRRIFLDKFGQQAATFALLSGFWALLVLAMATLIGRLRLPDAARAALGFPLPLAAVAVATLAGAAAFLAYRGLWQRLKAAKGLHTLLGLAATVCLWGALYAALAALRPWSLGAPAVDWAAYLCPPGGSLFWRCFVEGIALSLSLAGTFTGAWLIWRRGKDDFGRDYYNFTLGLTARIGFLAGLAALAGMVWLCLGLVPLVSELSSRETLAVALYGTGTLLTLVGTGFVMLQPAALRHKGTLIASLIFAIVALVGQLAGLTGILLPGLP